MFPAARAALLDAAEGDEQDEEREEAERAADDADLGAAGEGVPALVDARGAGNFFEDVGFAGLFDAVGVLVKSF